MEEGVPLQGVNGIHDEAGCVLGALVGILQEIALQIVVGLMQYLVKPRHGGPVRQRELDVRAHTPPVAAVEEADTLAENLTEQPAGVARLGFAVLMAVRVELLDVAGGGDDPVAASARIRQVVPDQTCQVWCQ